jgi:hypothetical protein
MSDEHSDNYNRFFEGLSPGQCYLLLRYELEDRSDTLFGVPRTQVEAEAKSLELCINNLIAPEPQDLN